MASIAKSESEKITLQVTSVELYYNFYNLDVYMSVCTVACTTIRFFVLPEGTVYSGSGNFDIRYKV